MRNIKIDKKKQLHWRNFTQDDLNMFNKKKTKKWKLIFLNRNIKYCQGNYYIKAKIYNRQQNSKCRLYGDDIVNNMISEYSEVA